MSIYELLQTDHARILTAFDQLQQIPQGEPEQRSFHLDELRTLLLAHTRAELQTLYAALEQTGDAGPALGKEVETDQNTFASLLEDLSATDPQMESWVHKVRSLRLRFEQHVDEVESQGFHTAERVLDEPTAEKLGQKMLDLQQQYKRRVESDGMPHQQDPDMPLLLKPGGAR